MNDYSTGMCSLCFKISLFMDLSSTLKFMDKIFDHNDFKEVQKQTNLSKALSWILRHGAVSEGLAVSVDGFVKLDDLLKHRNFRGKYTSADILQVTETNDKQRFQIRNSNGVLEIQACQGHSLRVVGNSGLTAITEHHNYPDVIHGTFLKHWPSIQSYGLSRMKRNHIHFATSLPRHGKVISGCRSDSQLFIYVDLEKSLNDGIPFFLSENGVVLTPGNNEGILDVRHFKRAVTDKGFSDSTTFQQLTEYFGKIAQIYAYNDKTAWKFALISFENDDAVNKILNMKHVINDQPVRVTRKIVRPEHRLSVSTASTDSNHQETKEATIKKLFDGKILESKGNFNDQLMYLISRVRLKPQQVERMAQLCTDLENDLGLIFPGCRARPFGSMVTGLGTIDSDVDCFIEFSGNFMPEDTSEDRATLQRQYIKKAKSVLYRYHRTYANIVAIPRASTPIIKFFHIPTQTNCDINFKDCIGVMNSDLIRFLLSFDKRLLPLFVFLKYLMKYYDICGRSQFTNYALTMMTFFYLQQPPSIIPPIHDLQQNCKFENIQDLWNCGFEQIEIPKNDNKLSITELLEGFFTFYKDFDYKNYVISPYIGSAVHVSKFESLDLPPELDLYKRNLDFDKPKIKCNLHITVQDPFRLCHNTTSVVGSKSLNEFLHICESASAICAKAHSTNTTNTLIKNLLDISVASTRGPRVALKLPYTLPQPEPVGLAAIAQLDALSAKMKDFIKSVLSKILTCTIREEEGEGRRTSYYCELHHPIWENRERFPELNKNKNVLEQNIAISERIVSLAEKSQLLFNFYFDFQIKERPKVILLHVLPGPKQNANNYGVFVNFCQQNIIRWYNKFMSLNATKPNNEANKSLKRSIEPIEVMSSEEEDKNALEPEDEKSRGDSPPEKVSKKSVD